MHHHIATNDAENHVDLSNKWFNGMKMNICGSAFASTKEENNTKWLRVVVKCNLYVIVLFEKHDSGIFTYIGILDFSTWVFGISVSGIYNH